MAKIIFWEKPGCNGNSRQKEILMVAEPLLIVRPLMQVREERLAGFDVQQVHNWISLALDTVGERDPKNCPCVISAP